MKNSNSHIFLGAYVILFLLLVFTGKNLMGYAICMLTIFGLLTNCVSIEFAFMTSLVMNSELSCILNLIICIIYMLTRKKFQHRSWRVNSKIALCVSVILINSILNMVINGAFFNTLFGILYYVFVIILASLLKGTFNENKLIDCAKKLLTIELLSEIAIIIKYRSFRPGDLHKGTLSNAHYFTFWLICIMLYVYVYYKESGMSFSKNVIKNIYWYIIGGVLIIMSDGKNVVLGLIVAALVYGVSYIFSKNTKNRVILSIGILYAGLFVMLLVLHLPFVKNFICQYFSLFSIYIYNPVYALKLHYFEGTIFEELKGVRAIFGFGIGQYGSRFANLFGYNYMYRENNAINNFVASHFSSVILPNYEKYASLYSKSIVDSIKWRSAVLTYPFSSIIAFLAENGILGLAFITYIWGKWANKSKYGIIVIFLFSSCIFDIYFDHISLLAVILVLVSSGVAENDIKDSRTPAIYSYGDN